ncbi:MAG: RHS repeat protein, partial [Ignavibacteria bacterium]|nr:RHS repeat protein [Ignavibacteria bacterium]
PSKTENPDASYTLISDTYLNGYSYSFGTISGMVIKKVLTDETGKNFEKFYDAVGNLRREIKYVEGSSEDNGEGGSQKENSSKNRNSNKVPSREGWQPKADGVGLNEDEDIPLITDYKYDDLYRVTEIKTPNDKHIYYSYDGLGRQSARTTPDAGTVKCKYDKNDNLRFSQDNNQANKPTERPPARYISFRGYDGINRLLYTGDAYDESNLPVWNSLNPDITNDFENYSNNPYNFLVINVYDTLTNYPAGANIFTAQLPSDYYSSAPNETNNTKGSLCATAYRTLGTDYWSYKYYRYDARGRVIKMWNYIAGLGEKTTIYEYNSQNQVTKLVYQSGYTDGRKYK